ncbi:stabilizer of axonemal microtubules 1 isoform X4 [Macaca fascicularis]|uniref:stabilizer of axonemal microtubules 1 isoform X4 n=1 Tax=Macaca fascicularis TaxID=9541 RepID=UPI003D15D0CA
MRNWCLCQICTCGRHHCPHGTTRIYENSGVFFPTTEYLEKYPMYDNVLPTQSLKPKQEIRACRGKMEGITTFKSDYRPYEIVKQPRHVPEEYKPKQEKIDLGTTYKQDFNSYKVQPVAIVRPLERQQVKKGKLDIVPTYKENMELYPHRGVHLLMSQATKSILNNPSDGTLMRSHQDLQLETTEEHMRRRIYL